MSSWSEPPGNAELAFARRVLFLHFAKRAAALEAPKTRRARERARAAVGLRLRTARGRTGGGHGGACALLLCGALRRRRWLSPAPARARTVQTNLGPPLEPPAVAVPPLLEPLVPPFGAVPPVGAASGWRAAEPFAEFSEHAKPNRAAAARAPRTISRRAIRAFVCGPSWVAPLVFFEWRSAARWQTPRERCRRCRGRLLQQEDVGRALVHLYAYVVSVGPGPLPEAKSKG
jgi:hypothetical protein